MSLRWSLDRAVKVLWKKTAIEILNNNFDIIACDNNSYIEHQIFLAAVVSDTVRYLCNTDELCSNGLENSISAACQFKSAIWHRLLITIKHIAKDEKTPTRPSD